MVTLVYYYYVAYMVSVFFPNIMPACNLLILWFNNNNNNNSCNYCYVAYKGFLPL